MKEVINNKTIQFKDSSKQKAISKIVHQTFYQCFDRQAYALDFSGDKECQRVIQFLENIQILRVRRISVRFSECPAFTKTIKNISFPVLSQIYLINCQIESVQDFMRIDIPHMKKLSLNDNKITNISVLRKIWGNLQQINLDGNKINKIANLSQIGGNIRRISLDFAEYDRPPNDSLGCLAKFPLAHNTKVFCNSTRRVRQSRVCIALFRKKIDWIF